MTDAVLGCELSDMFGVIVLAAAVKTVYNFVPFSLSRTDLLCMTKTENIQQVFSDVPRKRTNVICV